MKLWLSLCPDASQLLDGGAEKQKAVGRGKVALGTEALRTEASGDLPITDCSPPLPAQPGSGLVCRPMACAALMLGPAWGTMLFDTLGCCLGLLIELSEGLLFT